ncbi:uncharacterized protein LOC127805505 [Diospyros lotus]|uniref:uncharacterized protein LOC127805505 n=1 Tax=Diospyros lotus TaxID=55363 RepID=UPI002254687C|nr:uncharacterized protein LOC127805505 [Diospyros lotus]
MFRSAGKRLLLVPPLLRSQISRFPISMVPNYSSRFSSHTFADQSPRNCNSPHNPQPPNSSDSSEAHRQTPRAADYEDEQARVLSVSLRHVPRLGWSEAAMIAGAREAGVSPSIVGSFPRKEATLVEFFMDERLQRLIDRIESHEDLRNLIPSECISKLVRMRLEMQVPYISKWPEALSIQAQPQNFPTSFKQRAMLVDEIWHAVGDMATDVDWYVKRTVLGAIYSTTEVYMLTDSSPEFQDTWAFLDGRVKDAFDLKKSIQEGKYLVEAVGAGMGSSLQGFMSTVFRSNVNGGTT